MDGLQNHPDVPILNAIEPSIQSPLVEPIRSMRAAVREAVIGYVNNAPVIQTWDGKQPIDLDLKDILLLGALTGCDVLLSGQSGTGKTHLAAMAMAALFGPAGYFNKTITPGMSASDFLDIDFPAISRGEKTLRQAMQGLPMMKLPGIILNEVNRAPELLQAVLIPFLDRQLEVENVPIPLGIPYGAGYRYQFRILTINEGADYTGIVTLDRAVRERAVIEVPMDLFPVSSRDLRVMLAQRSNAQLTVNESKDRLPNLLEAHQLIQNLPLDILAQEFLVYLNGLGNCIRSQTGSKSGISFTPALCGGCHLAAAENGICGAVYKPSPRSLINLQSVARGIAAIRIAEGGQIQTVTLDDLMAAAPLVLYSKLCLNPVWVGKDFQGNGWAAIRRVISVACSRFKAFLESFNDVIQARARSEELSREQIERYHCYTKEKDAWCATWEEAGLEGSEKQKDGE